MLKLQQAAVRMWALLDRRWVAALGWLGAALACRCKGHALWGLAYAAYPGLVLVVARDLAEVLAAALLLAGILLSTVSGRWWPRPP